MTFERLRHVGITVLQSFHMREFEEGGQIKSAPTTESVEYSPIKFIHSRIDSRYWTSDQLRAIADHMDGIEDTAIPVEQKDINPSDGSDFIVQADCDGSRVLSTPVNLYHIRLDDTTTNGFHVVAVSVEVAFKLVWEKLSSNADPRLDLYFNQNQSIKHSVLVTEYRNLRPISSGGN